MPLALVTGTRPHLGRPATRLAVVPLAAFVPVDAFLDLSQWEMPTPPLVSAP